MKYLLLLACLFISASLLPTPANADTDQSAEIEAFKISGIVAEWFEPEENSRLEFNKNISTELMTKSDIGGSNWKAEYFGTTGTNWTEIRCGAPWEQEYTPAISNLSPIPDAISSIKLSISAKRTDNNSLNAIRLEVSETPDMNGSTVTVIENPDVNAAPQHYTLVIPEPKTNMFYRIGFDCRTTLNYKNEGWLAVTSLTFYRTPSPVPTISAVNDANGSPDHIEIISESGDLHLIVHEYDVDNNFYREITGPTAGPAPSRSAPQYSDSWTNKVASANETYSLDFPSEQGHYIYIRAKTVDGETHSPETATIFTSAGIETGVDSPTSDSIDQTAVYFDIQGRIVSAPSIPGIYLRRQNNHTTKIIIR